MRRLISGMTSDAAREPIQMQMNAQTDARSVSEVDAHESTESYRFKARMGYLSRKSAPAICTDSPNPNQMELHMMIKRFLTYAALALCACLGSAAFAVERPVSYLVHSMDRMTDMHLAATARLELTLAQWREGSEATDSTISSNLRASSNHFVMSSAKPGTEEYEGYSPV